MEDNKNKKGVLRMWAVTLNPEEAMHVEATSQNGVEFTFNNKRWVIVIGPKEGRETPTGLHRHLAIKCLDGPNRKQATREAIMHYTGLPETALTNNYFKPIETTWLRYVIYCFKDDKGQIDAALEYCKKEILEAGHLPNKRNMEELLQHKFGAAEYNMKFKAPLDSYLRVRQNIDSRGINSKPLDREANRAAFERSFDIFKGQVTRCLEADAVSSRWKNWSTLRQEDQMDIICSIALLPICCVRNTLLADELPGLYLWGNRNCGKSAFFDNGVFLKKIATDAEGVGKFILSASQAGFLLDDIGKKYMLAESRAATLKQLLQGKETAAKGNGYVSEQCGFVVMTSNDRPILFEKEPTAENGIDMTPGDWYNHKGAWLRRLLVIHFRNTLDELDLIDTRVVWSDYRIRDAAAAILHQILERIKDRQHALYRLSFEGYHDVIKEDYKDYVFGDCSYVYVPFENTDDSERMYQERLARVEQYEIEYNQKRKRENDEEEASTSLVVVQQPAKKLKGICSDCKCHLDSSHHLNECVEKKNGVGKSGFKCRHGVLGPCGECMYEKANKECTKEMNKQASPPLKSWERDLVHHESEYGPWYWKRRYADHKCEDHESGIQIVGECIFCEYENRGKYQCKPHTVYNCPLCWASRPE